MASDATLKNRETRDSTKIESMAESIESMALAVASVMIARCKGDVSKPLQTCLDNARTDLRQTLREFLAPALRLASGAHQENQVVSDAERVRCSRCSRTQPCSDNCMSWHRTIRAPDKEPDDEPPRAA